MPEPRDFAEFYAAWFRPLTHQLYAHTGDLAEAQDVVQEAFVRAWQRWSTLDEPVAWIRRVAWNLATSRWRRAKRMLHIARSGREEHIAGPGPDAVALRAALATLPPRHRQAVVLHYIADASIAEIAEITGAAEGTVKSWLHRGRAALSARLSDDGDNDNAGTEVRHG